MNDVALRLFPRRLRQISLGVTLTFFAAAMTASPAQAQISRVGGTTGLVGANARGSDVAFDPVNNVYLVVNAFGPAYGIFVNTAGAAVSQVFTLGSTNANSPFAQYPRVRYSPDVSNGVGGLGGFLVAWHQNDGVPNGVHAQIVSWASPSHIVGADNLLSDYAQDGSWWQAGPAIAYSSTSHRFLVAWQTLDNGIQGRLVDLNGAGIGAVLPFANPGGARDPGLTWNPSNNQFGLSYNGWTDSGAFAAFRMVSPSDGSLSPRSTFGFSAGTYHTDIDVNRNSSNFVMGWSNAPGSNAAVFDTGGNLLGSGLISGALGDQDSLSLAFNSVSGTFLAIGQGQSTEVVAAELNGNGVPITNVATVTDANGSGSFYPRTTSSTTSQWDIAYAHSFGQVADQIVATSSRGGGSSTTFGGAPSSTPTNSTPTTPVNTTGCATPDPFAAIGGGTCVNGGWLPPGSSSSPSAPTTPVVPTTPTQTSTGCTSVQPGANWVCSNGGWLPPGSAGTTTTTTVTMPTSSGTTTTTIVSNIPCSGNPPVSGWVCVNGGWLPPDHPLAIAALNSGSTGTTTVTTTTTTTTSSGGCTTPDPFSSIPGMFGVCINGGWIPSSNPGSRSGGH